MLHVSVIFLPWPKHAACIVTVNEYKELLYRREIYHLLSFCKKEALIVSDSCGGVVIMIKWVIHSICALLPVLFSALWSDDRTALRRKICGLCFNVIANGECHMWKLRQLKSVNINYGTANAKLLNIRIVLQRMPLFAALLKFRSQELVFSSVPVSGCV